VLLLAAAAALPGQTSAPASDRRLEISSAAGYGRHTGEEGGTRGVSAFGAALGWRSLGSHGLEFGYLFMDMKLGRRSWHLVSMGYVVQPRSGQVRPFFQTGVGTGVERVGPRAPSPGVPASVYNRTFTSSLGGVFVAGGATVDVRESFFIRPKLSYYFIACGGPNRLILPSLAVGWRF
jgi:hypothetical protein